MHLRVTSEGFFHNVLLRMFSVLICLTYIISY